MASWDEKAAFMRRVNATSATWDEVGDLRSLTLQSVQPQPPRPAAASQERPLGPAQRMAEAAKRRHEIMFAASSVRPKLVTDEPESVVPRGARVKEAAAHGSHQTNGR